MAANRRVTYGVGIAIGIAVVVLAVPSQQGIRIVQTNSPGIVSGSGTPSNPLNVTLTPDGTTMTGTGSAGSPLSAPAIATLPLGMFGDGSDGSSSPCGTISSNTTLSRTIYCTSLTVNSGITLNPGGYRIFVNGTLTLNGKIAVNGGNGCAGSGCGGAGGGNGYKELCPGGTGGSSGTSGGTPNLQACGGGGFPLEPDECSNSGGGGGTSVNGGVATAGGACKGGGGGRGNSNGTGNGGNGGQVNPANLNGGSWRAPYSAYYMMVGGSLRSGGSSPFGLSYTGGTGGGAGNAGDFQGQCLVGGGGGGGGVIMIAAKKIVGSGTVESIGGNGASAGATGGNPICGGGGGGGGGVISIFIGTGSFPSTNVSGGSFGNGRGGGTAGAAGGAGKTVLIKVGS